MVCITTISTGNNATLDLFLLIKSIELFENPSNLPTLYIATDDKTKPMIESIKYKGTKKIYTIMNDYTDKTRSMMEASHGVKFPTLFHDYTAMKLDIMRIAFEAETDQKVYFLDSDICLLAPLPTSIIPSSTKLGLSPHYIKKHDETLYGKYNAGYIYMTDKSLLDVWKSAIYGSRFFEQAALEDVAKSISSDQLFEFPDSHNFGWWRMYQSSNTPAEQLARFGINRSVGAGITLDSKPLFSIHTHFTETISKSSTKSSPTSSFNTFIIDQLKKLERGHKPAKALLHYIHSILPKEESKK
jgi:hypothetical protein